VAAIREKFTFDESDRFIGRASRAIADDMFSMI
jgi:hypothetical protein